LLHPEAIVNAITAANKFRFSIMVQGSDVCSFSRSVVSIGNKLSTYPPELPYSYDEERIAVVNAALIAFGHV
jgi:hypothetical protein